MTAFLVNPRRSPRAPVRCEGRIALRAGGYFPSPTSDYGPRGCQVVAPKELPPGMRVFVELRNERLAAPVELAGRVAWIAKRPPWHMGVAFDEASLPAADGFFTRLAAAYPGIDTYGQAPDRIPEDAALAPTAPPELPPVLSDDEADVLAALGPGMRASVLLTRLGPAREQGLPAIFSLLGRRYLRLGPPDRAAAAGWAKLLPLT